MVQCKDSWSQFWIRYRKSLGTSVTCKHISGNNFSSSRGAAGFQGCACVHTRGTRAHFSLGAPGKPSRTDGPRDWLETAEQLERRWLTEPPQFNFWMIVIGALWEGILDSCRRCLRQLLPCLAQSECLNVLVNILREESGPALQRVPVVISAAERIKLCITKTFVNS